MSAYGIFIGIDPGLDGAVGVLWPNSKVETHRTPTLKVGSRRQLVVVEMVSIILESYFHNRTFAILENVHSMPGQGVASSFSFGRGFGFWEGILAAIGVPYQLVAPQTWKAAMLRDMPKDKNAAKLQALRLWPELGSLSDGEAEALLIAEYGRRLHLG